MNIKKPCKIFDSHTPQAFVLTCIDYRLIDDEAAFMNHMGYNNNYDGFALAGASLGYNQDDYSSWKQSLKDHIDIAVQLHNINQIWVIDHMDCGAYKLFYNDKKLSPDDEKQLHKQNLTKFKQFMNKLYPSLKVRCFLMEINGETNELINI